MKKVLFLILCFSLLLSCGCVKNKTKIKVNKMVDALGYESFLNVTIDMVTTKDDNVRRTVLIKKYADILYIKSKDANDFEKEYYYEYKDDGTIYCYSQNVDKTAWEKNKIESFINTEYDDVISSLDTLKSIVDVFVYDPVEKGYIYDVPNVITSKLYFNNNKLVKFVSIMRDTVTTTFSDYNQTKIELPIV